MLRIIAAGSGIAAVIALAVSTQTYLSMPAHGHAFHRIFVWQLGVWTFWGLVAPLVLRGGARFAVRRGGVLRNIGRSVALGLALFAVHGASLSQLAVWVQPFTPVVTYDFGRAFASHLPSLFAIDLLVYGLLLVCGAALAANDRSRQLELRESRLEAELARAELHALRLEIEPHFLFNTLNAIAALIRLKDNRRALDMLVELGEFMRTNLDHPQQPFVPLASEIDWVQRYVKLQQTRFGDRLDVRYDIDRDCLDATVPTLLLQPIVENALRHGAARQTERCRVTIGAAFENGGLRITVADDGAGLPRDFDIATGAGTGLRNIRSRLEHIYGAAATLDVRRRDPAGTTVDITLPITSAMPAGRATA